MKTSVISIVIVGLVLLLCGCRESTVGNVAIAQLSSYSIEQGDTKTLTITYTSADTGNVTFTVTTPGGVQIWPSNSCTISGSGSCTLTIAADYLATPRQSQIVVTTSSPHVTVVNSPLSFNIIARQDPSYAHITNIDITGTVDDCTLNDGILTGCQFSTESALMGTSTRDIVFNAASDGQVYAYITNQSGGSGQLLYCQLDSNSGDLINCAVLTLSGTSGDLSQPRDVAVYSNSIGESYLYIADTGNSEVDVCQLNSGGNSGDGTIVANSCRTVSTTGISLTQPRSLAIDQASNSTTYFYIGDSGSGGGGDGEIFYCTWSDFDTLTDCASAMTGLQRPRNLAVHIANDGNTYLYIADAGEGLDSGNDGNVYYCPLASDGDLNGCSMADRPANARTPNSIAFYIGSDGQTYAYIASGDNVNSTPQSPDAIYYCTVLDNGNFGACSNANVSELLLATPMDIRLY